MFIDLKLYNITCIFTEDFEFTFKLGTKSSNMQKHVFVCMFMFIRLCKYLKTKMIVTSVLFNQYYFLLVIIQINVLVLSVDSFHFELEWVGQAS